jgi:two-component system nitrogen regulation response regulator NtrX
MAISYYTIHRTRATVLLVDDDPHVRENLQEILSYEGFSCIEARDGKEALESIGENQIDLMLLDLKLPRVDGMEVLKQSIAKHPYLPVVVISGQGTIKLAVESTKIGAYDFLEKPLEAERVLVTVRNALRTSQLKLQRDKLLSDSRNRYRMIGADPKMEKVFTLIDRAASVDSKVLISGEAGTGKELVSHAIHLNSDRAGFPFVPVNCSAIPENLIESELFGHVKGAFTGAIANHQGKFHRADHGTLFLDEIGDMSLMMQAKLLRVIEDGLVEPVGSRTGDRVDVRIICATHKNLKKEVEEANFRNDLYYRLNVIPVRLPPLRDRRGDIRPLAEAFLEEICTIEGLPEKGLAQNVWPVLMDYDWPGNIRELRNLIERAAVLTNETLIDAHLIHEAMQSEPLKSHFSAREQTLREARSQFEREFILKTLTAHQGKIQESAEALGIQRSHLWKKMKRYGIERVPKSSN